MVLQWKVHEHRHAAFVEYEFFLPRHLSLEEATQVEVPLEDATSPKGVGLSGKGPHWLYAQLLATIPDDHWVAVMVPQESAFIVVRESDGTGPKLGSRIPLQSRLPAQTVAEETCQNIVWSEHQIAGARSIELKLNVQETINLNARVFRELARQWSPEVWNATQIVFNRVLPVSLLCAAIVTLRSRNRDAAVLIYDPKLAGAVCVAPGKTRLQNGLLVKDPDSGRAASLVALLGDPNSGKSVLSHKLYRVLQKGGVRVYRLDCDASAPTALWGTDTPDGKKLREQYKAQRGGWQEGDAEYLAQTAETLRHADHLDWVLFDMPGGIHKGPSAPCRIPHDREDLFHAIDYFVLLACDETARRGWEESLENLGLKHRIVAIVHPSTGAKPESLPAKDGHPGLPEWRVSKLDRAEQAEITPAVEDLARHILSRSKTRRG